MRMKLLLLSLAFMAVAGSAAAAEPASTAGLPAAGACVAPGPALSSLEALLGGELPGECAGATSPAAAPRLNACTCTSERSICKQDCLGLGCLSISFTCNTADPCLSDCVCLRCIA